MDVAKKMEEYKDGLSARDVADYFLSELKVNIPDCEHFSNVRKATADEVERLKKKDEDDRLGFEVFDNLDTDLRSIIRQITHYLSECKEKKLYPSNNLLIDCSDRSYRYIEVLTAVLTGKGYKTVEATLGRHIYVYF